MFGVEISHKARAMREALEKSRGFKKFNVIPWNIVVSRRSPRDMANAIREYSHKGIVALEGIYYKNPEHVVQCILENEQLALRVESAANQAAALVEIKSYAGLDGLHKNL